MSWNRGAVFPAVMAAILVCTFSAAASPFASDRDGVIDCVINNGPCSKQLVDTGIIVTFGITPNPVEAMKTLLFRIDLKAGSAPVTDGEVSLDLAMPGMAMPKNMIKLAHQGGGKYEGSGVIVKCPSGSGVWQTEVRIRRLSSQGQPQRVRFTFRVK
jgi:hypothetical protein